MTIEAQIKEIALQSVLPEIQDYLRKAIDGERLLDMSEAAAMFGISENTLRTYMKRPADPLPFGRIGDRIKFKKSEVWKWMKRNNKKQCKDGVIT